MKRILFCFILLLISISYHASSQVLIKGFSAGLNLGATQSFTDISNSDVKARLGAELQYNLNEFVFANVDVSSGKFSRQNLDQNGFSFINSYNRITATANLALGQLLNPESRVSHFFIYNLYAGTGIGLVMGKVSEPEPSIQKKFKVTPYEGFDLTLPVNIGLNFKISSYLYPDSPLSFNVNLQHNFLFTDRLDGYDASTLANKFKDSFGSATLGLKYSFGDNNRLF